MAHKKSVTLSVDTDIDEFFDSMRVKIVKLQGKEVKFIRTKNELYLEALRFSIENADKWLFGQITDDEEAA